MAAVASSGGRSFVLVQGWDKDSIMPDEVKPPLASKQACAKEILNFCRETAAYASMAVGLGGSHDNPRLRTELWKCRLRAMRLAGAIRQNLVPLLKRQMNNAGDGDDLERLYRMYSSCLELFLLNLSVAHSLQRVFRCGESDVISVINTGIVEAIQTQKNSHAKNCNIFTIDTVNTDESASIERQIEEVKDMIHDINQRFDVQPWDVQPNVDIFSQLDNKSLYSEFENDYVTIHEPSLRRRRRCVFIVATVISVVAVTGIMIGLILPVVNR